MRNSSAFHRSATSDRDALSIREGGYRAAAKSASERLLIALLRYGTKHGLPNMSADQCRALLEAEPCTPPYVPPTVRGPRGNCWRPEEDQDAVSLRRQGETYRTISRAVERSPAAVAARLRYLGGVPEL